MGEDDGNMGGASDDDVTAEGGSFVVRMRGTLLWERSSSWEDVIWSLGPTTDPDPIPSPCLVPNPNPNPNPSLSARSRVEIKLPVSDG